MVPIVDGILRLRTFLQRPGDKMPRIYFDPKCSSTIDEFGKHKYRLQKDNRPIREEPIDRDNHGLKSIIYWLVVNFDFVDRSNPRQEEFPQLYRSPQPGR